jgi:dephospho-CoA kinase
MKPVIGLIGGMGSGKSRVAELFAERGARVVSGDELGHEALRQPEVQRQLVSYWGPGVLNPDGTIDRRGVARIVFDDPAERRKLEAVVHPWIERRLDAEIEAAQRDPTVRLIVVDAAIMLESGWSKHCNRLVYVQAPEELRLRRLAETRSWTPAEVQAREDAQMSLEDKVKRADHVLDNSGSAEQTSRQIDDLLSKWELSRHAL